MTTRQLTDGWKIICNASGHPQLMASGIVCVETSRGELYIDIQDGAGIRIPLTAITALMQAHADWLKHTAETRKETAT